MARLSATLISLYRALPDDAGRMDLSCCRHQIGAIIRRIWPEGPLRRNIALRHPTAILSSVPVIMAVSAAYGPEKRRIIEKGCTTKH